MSARVLLASLVTVSALSALPAVAGSRPTQIAADAAATAPGVLRIGDALAIRPDDGLATLAAPGTRAYLAGADGALVSGLTSGVRAYLSPDVEGLRLAVDFSDLGLGAGDLYGAPKRASDTSLLYATSLGALGFELGLGVATISPAGGAWTEREARSGSALHLGGRVGLHGVTVGIAAIRGGAMSGPVPTVAYAPRGISTSIGFESDDWSVAGSYELRGRMSAFGGGFERSSSTKLGASISLAPGLTIFGDWSRLNATAPDGSGAGRRDGATYLLGTAIKF